VKARGDQRSMNMAAIGWSAFLLSVAVMDKPLLGVA